MIESNLKVRFGNDARYVKLDEHRFYSYISGRGFKSVDFLVIDPEIGLVLVELKNFEKAKIMPSKSDLAQVFYEKCEDTLHLLEIINSYYKRKWWYKALGRSYLINFLTSEIRFWHDAFELYESGKVILLGHFE